MTIHTVRPGECLSSIAASYGFPDWRKIYEHPDNAGFRELRPDPDLIHPGDQVFVPDLTNGAVAAGSGDRARFRKRVPRTVVRIAVKLDHERAIAGRRFVLTCGDARHEGVTDGGGGLEYEVPCTCTRGVLQVFLDDTATAPHYTWDLGIGHLDPIVTVSGIQARLNNLGYESGPVDGIRGPITEAAVRTFQAVHGLAVDGIPGPVTQGKLEEVHGS